MGIIPALGKVSMTPFIFVARAWRRATGRWLFGRATRKLFR